ncbi:3-oxoacid CoA-transferase subunit B [Rhodococcus koreensis]|uniref:3-oxoacid CoA-transferase subunit B n=1 Tax=Rhodococcus koreensis TaxID=99653 RepID=UPI0036DB7C39
MSTLRPASSEDRSLGLEPVAVAREVAIDLPDGSVVNLGIGMPQRVGEMIPRGREVILQAENGVIGIGANATDEQQDMDLIDAGKRPITLVEGASIVDHAQSFALIRGGHLDACVMGAYEVSVAGDLANWSTGGAKAPAVGGAMDLALGAREVIVLMKHLGRHGAPKIVARCSLPLTAPGVVTRIYTELGIFQPAGDRLIALGLATDLDEVRRLTPGITVDIHEEHVTLPRVDEEVQLPVHRRHLTHMEEN